MLQELSARPTPTNPSWSIDFHITVAQILVIILVMVLKQNFIVEDTESNNLLLLTYSVHHFDNFEVTHNMIASFFTTPQVRKDNSWPFLNGNIHFYLLFQMHIVPVVLC